MNMIKTLTTSFALLIAATIATSQAASLKIGIVDMRRVYSEYYKTKEYEAKLSKEREEASRKLQEKMDEYKGVAEQIQRLNRDLQNEALSEQAKSEKSKERDERIAKIKGLEREIQEFRTTREGQLQEEALSLREDIVSEINALTEEHAKNESFDLVFDSSGNSLNQVPVLLYTKDAIDFSDAIIEKLNKEAPKGKKEEKKEG